MSNIVNITIKVASEEVTMSVEEAKKLYEELGLVFSRPEPAPFNIDWFKPISPVVYGPVTSKNLT